MNQRAHHPARRLFPENLREIMRKRSNSMGSGMRLIPRQGSG
jgi:hypothetical protein